MNELYQRINELKNNLDNESCIQDLIVSMEEIKNNEKLVSQIRAYNLNRSDELKRKILSNNEIIKYKHQETEVNLLILEIRKELKRITSKGGCSKCE
mgnify:FL=1